MRLSLPPPPTTAGSCSKIIFQLTAEFQQRIAYVIIVKWARFLSFFPISRGITRRLSNTVFQTRYVGCTLHERRVPSQSPPLRFRARILPIPQTAARPQGNKPWRHAYFVPAGPNAL